MTSQWGYPGGISPSGGWFSPGLRPRENHPPSGDIPSGYPHWGVIFVYCTSILFEYVRGCVEVFMTNAKNTFRNLAVKTMPNLKSILCLFLLPPTLFICFAFFQVIFNI